MHSLLVPNRMVLPPPRPSAARTGGPDMRLDAGRSPAATVSRSSCVRAPPPRIARPIRPKPLMRTWQSWEETI
jgi:hypothetical protein